MASASEGGGGHRRGSGEGKGVLFVCLGNICRSPLAEGVMRHLVTEAGEGASIRVASAGTGDYHVGSPPHARGIACAKRHGIDISGQRARQLCARDFSEFDLVVVMDRSNQTDASAVRRRCKTPRAQVRLFTSFMRSPSHVDVPDCYYADDVDASFEEVHGMLTEGCAKILEHLRGPA